ncbi:hypothetical protein [Vagococcus xieshaowenii]|uniref:Uncharacterized protein n=1 Tax=Vagococcus xieshaowenii TaxID=2562451 RepID=A0ABX5TG95_9ENTE|nr:hypothetical protein [Vagococcus xieshaowenii]QCA29655.1 hypothetical protein E4Z98_09710 [Vagococcus xieshaowenii]
MGTSKEDKKKNLLWSDVESSILEILEWFESDGENHLLENYVNSKKCSKNNEWVSVGGIFI